MLHRELWAHVNGSVPKAHAVVPVQDDWDDFSPGNWLCRPHASNGKKFEAVHPRIVFEGKNYYKASDCPYYYHTSRHGTSTRKTLLHRDIYVKFHGEVPEGHHVHHADFDAANNDSTNLVALTQSDHQKLHLARRSAGL